MRATRIAISGFSSNVGKTTLLCDLLRRTTDWEAIKISRGHYRSCGKDPAACCVSPLLGDQPLILQGRANTFAPGKDTGRYWEAGAAEVQWVICTSEQVEAGVNRALARVTHQGVFLEGTSFLKAVAVDYSVMVMRKEKREIKSSAVGVFHRIDAIFMSEQRDAKFLPILNRRLQQRGIRLEDVKIFYADEIDRLAAEIGQIHQARLAVDKKLPIPK